MGLSNAFDISRVTNLENRATTDEAVMLLNNTTNSQTIKGQLIQTAALNAIECSLDPATNGVWYAIWNPVAGRYNLALGRFATASEAIELRSYWDKFTIRTGRSAGATNSDINLITNDQSTAGVSSNINLQPNITIAAPGIISAQADTYIYPKGTANGNGFHFMLGGNNTPRIVPTNTTTSNLLLSMAANSLDVRNAADSAWQTVNASAFTVASERDYKTDIQDFDENALDHIKRTKVKRYKLKTDNEKDSYRVGLIRDEAPAQIQKEDRIDLYQMTSLLWAAVQQLTEKVEALTQ